MHAYLFLPFIYVAHRLIVSAVELVELFLDYYHHEPS